MEHEHCGRCFVPAQCKHSKCPLLHCPQQCGATLHACKLEDHTDQICAEAWTRCVNAESGCPARVRRRRRGVHLLHCPASVVVCPATWHRWPLCSQTLSHLKTGKVSSAAPEEEDALDILLARRDQDTLLGALRIPRRLRDRFADKLYFPGLPLLPLPVPANVDLDTESGEGTSEDSQEEDPEESHNPTTMWEANRASCEEFGWDYDLLPSLPPSDFDRAHDPTLFIRCSLCRDRPHPDKTGAKKEPEPRPKFESPIPVISPLYSGAHLSLNLQPEFLSYFKRKPKGLLSFGCQSVVERSRFSGHYQMAHTEVGGGLSGWIIRRCPLAQYGCTYYETRLRPETGALSQCPSTGHLALIETGSPSDFNLLDLPFDLHIRIASYLDGYSSQSLAAVSRHFAKVVPWVVKSNGVLHLQWTKSFNPRGGVEWRSEPQWVLSSSQDSLCKPIKWVHEESRMTDHLGVCDFGPRLVHSRPFPVPSMQKKP